MLCAFCRHYRFPVPVSREPPRRTGDGAVSPGAGFHHAPAGALLSPLVPRIALAAALIVSGAMPSGGQAVGRSPAELGRVDFPTSCNPGVGPAFITGVALLHSFWFSEGEKTFKEILA